MFHTFLQMPFGVHADVHLITHLIQGFKVRFDLLEVAKTCIRNRRCRFAAHQTFFKHGFGAYALHKHQVCVHVLCQTNDSTALVPAAVRCIQNDGITLFNLFLGRQEELSIGERTGLL